jgi:tetraacyldisaccharide 4'-kinase
MTRRLFLPFTPLYMAAVVAKNTAFDHGWTKARQLRRPVISVGNISVGGSGKTPFVIYMAKLLSQQGVHVDPSGNADRFGDEPLLIARSAHVPVYVGASRYAAGLLAEREDAATAIHLLDDGFQHRKLVRNVDIVLIHRSDFAETLLPAGRLRESLSALKRASLLVLLEEDAGLEAQLKQRGIEKPIWWMTRSITVPENTGRALAFCGIAHPADFFRSLQTSGIEIAATHTFRDHHAYSSVDIQELLQAAQSHAVDTFLITEKDFVRLSPGLREALTALAPVKMVKLEAHLHDETAALRQLQALLPTIFERPL